MTPTQFAWSVVGGYPYPPPHPHPAPDDRCWLCGGPAGNDPWPRDVAFAPTFTTFSRAAIPHSDSVCQACVAMAKGETWNAYVAGREDELQVKSGNRQFWYRYDHLFTATGHECPRRPRWRELLLDPPEPPFLAVITESGQKHIIWQAQVAHSRDVYPLQMEEDTLLIDRHLLADCLAAFEHLYHLGFSKESIVTGRYHHGQMLKVGITDWREAESQFAPWRVSHPELIRAAAYVAQREETPA